MLAAMPPRDRKAMTEKEHEFTVHSDKAAREQGFAGLTLGGGFGWLTREYGMTIDNLVSVDLVMADGASMRASDRENPDLFWAVRGGGGNFGVVTGFEFKLHPVGPEIYSGLLVFPFSQARQVIEKYREFVKTAPEELNVWAVLRKAPPLPFLPAGVHGQEMVALAVCYAGGAPNGRKLVEPLHRFGNAHGEHIGLQPYTQWQQAFDPLLTPGARNYWKSHNFTEISDGALDAVLRYAGRLPTAQCEIFIGLIAGAANRVAADATAYGQRDTRFVLNVHGRWDDPADDGRCIAWARDFFKASAPYASAGAYVNFMTEDETDRISAAYGSSYARLVQIKRKYDPENIFHMNQNIRP
jgi:FAD/FMN-containing dehydrogenase